MFEISQHNMFENGLGFFRGLFDVSEKLCLSIGYVGSRLYEIRDCRRRVSEIEIREILNIEVLKCLAKLMGACP